MADEGFERKLAVILSADVEGYGRRMDDDQEATVRTLTSHRTAISNLVEQFRGRVVDSPGANLLSEFKSVVDSVNCAVEIQREPAERNEALLDKPKRKYSQIWRKSSDSSSTHRCAGRTPSMGGNR